jgi:hypothetical protein
MRYLALLVLLFAQDSKPDWGDLVRQGLKNVHQLRTIRSKLPRAEFSVPALAESLGKDPKKAAEFVEKNIGYEPYRGFMKGPQGTLMSLGGNSADRALLLAALLSECGTASKLVRGTLAVDQHPAGSPMMNASEVSIEDACKALNADPAKIRARLAENRARATKFLQTLWTRVDRDHKVVADALRSAGVTLPDPEKADPTTDYWWVRTADGDIGKPADAQEVSVHDVAELPSEEFHRVAIRMKIKQNDDEFTVLDSTFRSAEFYGQIVKIGNVPHEGMGKLLNLKADFNALTDALTSSKTYIPTLITSSKTINGQPFDLSGNRPKIKDGVIQKVKDVAGLFDQLPGGEKKDEEKKELTGNWLEFDLLVPGLDPVTMRRSIFAKGATGNQRAFDLVSSRDLLLLPGELSAHFVLDLFTGSAIAQQEMLLSQWKDPKTIPSDIRPMLNATLYRFALARRIKGAPLGRTRPTLVSYVQRFIDGKPLKTSSCIDILDNHTVGGSPLLAGLFDTALEHEIHAGHGRHLNTSVLLEKALLENRPVRVVKESIPQDLELSETARREIEAGLESYAFVVVPGKPASWYRIHLKTGVTLGFVEGGGGQDSAEYGMMAVNMLRQVLEWKSKVELLNSVLECIMNAMEAADPNASLATCMGMVIAQEAFGWAAGGIWEGAGDALGGSSAALWATIGSEGMSALLGSALGIATGGGR